MQVLLNWDAPAEMVTAESSMIDPAMFNTNVFVEELPLPPIGAVAVKMQLRPPDTTLEHAKDSKVCPPHTHTCGLASPYPEDITTKKLYLRRHVGGLGVGFCIVLVLDRIPF